MSYNTFSTKKRKTSSKKFYQTNPSAPVHKNHRSKKIGREKQVVDFRVKSSHFQS